MRKKIILALLILLSLFVVVILPASLNVCLPDGCSFGSNTCDNTSCIDETLGQHLNERASLFSAVVKSQSSLVLLAVVLFAFFGFQRYLKRCFLELIQLVAAKLYVKYKLFNSSCSKLFDYLLEAFSDGILHPQIYSPAN